MSTIWSYDSLASVKEIVDHRISAIAIHVVPGTVHVIPGIIDLYHVPCMVRAENCYGINSGSIHQYFKCFCITCANTVIIAEYTICTLMEWIFRICQIIIIILHFFYYVIMSHFCFLLCISRCRNCTLTGCDLILHCLCCLTALTSTLELLIKCR